MESSRNLYRLGNVLFEAIKKDRIPCNVDVHLTQMTGSIQAVHQSLDPHVRELIVTQPQMQRPQTGCLKQARECRQQGNVACHSPPPCTQHLRYGDHSS